ncbi:hypothetical protein BD289DRAFT_181712 [Coniella lustricola]|uniref:Uncharacterized protein n=1 Tax=Coniella lustricola TaxID=2025994 RepID=A0A2T3ADH3_9PEZI|nr:hypothetical protein BD289DRAFT_181712 [Coniella lustricola]
MPLRLKIGKRVGGAPEDSTGDRRHLSNAGNANRSRSANLDPSEADRERSRSPSGGRFRSISPIVKPALSGNGSASRGSGTREDGGIMTAPTTPTSTPTVAAAGGRGGSSWTGPVTTVQRTLSTASYTEFDLVNHLHDISGKHAETVLALGDVYRQRDELTVLTLFSLDPEVLDTGNQAAACEVYEVRQDGSVVPWYDSCADRHNEGLEASPTWSLIKVDFPFITAKYSLVSRNETETDRTDFDNVP